MIDEWSGLADLLANLIEKYASELDIAELPDPEPEIYSNNTEEILQAGLDKGSAA